MAEPLLLHRRIVEAELLAPILRELDRELGPERADALVARAVSAVASETGRTLRAGRPAGDLAGIEALWERLADGGALDVETVERSASTLSLRVTRCAYAEAYAARGLVRVGKLLSCGRDAPLLAGYSAALSLSRRTCLLDGDASCELTYQEVP